MLADQPLPRSRDLKICDERLPLHLAGACRTVTDMSYFNLRKHTVMDAR